MPKVVFVIGESDSGRHVFEVFDRQSGECLADDLFRTKGAKAIVVEALVDFDQPSVQVLSPYVAPPHPGFGVMSERDRLKDVPRWRRWIERL